MASRCSTRSASGPALVSDRAGCAGSGASLSEHAVATLTEISGAPERWPALVDDLRKRPLRGFPYRIVYQQRRDHVLIVAVMHERQRPNYWLERV